MFHFMFYLGTDVYFAQVLECFELQPDDDVFIELIPIFPKVDNLKSYVIPMFSLWNLRDNFLNDGLFLFYAVSCVTDSWV